MAWLNPESGEVQKTGPNAGGRRGFGGGQGATTQPQRVAAPQTMPQNLMQQRMQAPPAQGSPISQFLNFYANQPRI